MIHAFDVQLSQRAADKAVLQHTVMNIVFTALLAQLGHLFHGEPVKRRDNNRFRGFELFHDFGDDLLFDLQILAHAIAPPVRF